MITVRYTGGKAAILAGFYIYEGETRRVSAAQLAIAEAAHPGAFEVVAGERPAPVEPQGAEVSQPDGSGDTAVPDETAGGETAEVQEPDPAPTPVAPAPVAPAPSQRPSHSRHERRR